MFAQQHSLSWEWFIVLTWRSKETKFKKHFYLPALLSGSILHALSALGTSPLVLGCPLCVENEFRVDTIARRRKRNEFLIKRMRNVKMRHQQASCWLATTQAAALGCLPNLMNFVFIIFMKVKMLFALMRICVFLAALLTQASSYSESPNLSWILAVHPPCWLLRSPSCQI